MSLSIDVTQDLEACLKLRFEVFVDEQGVPVEEERDALDDSATHLLALQDGTPVGTARIVFQDDTAKIGRVCVVKTARGTGLGAKLIEACVSVARNQAGITRAKLGAQTHAIGFYEKLGFEVYGPVYLDAGIDHRDMVKPL
ncbi:GNAT family N-acetyltransferase [Tritonibacter mobilis]|uniref:GNAT family N-acetyltransferase n=1 Tax=Tritonibacter mobilis TaxID=379347 RepID=UPI000E0D295C|nr:GNAT family N-acetyltransferase [Tritonibacter mobilis]MCA2006152.1 GNAT family N-acetyltransferase [Tritonibacter mobilis]NHM18121.1 GNAT family N-acetyltransferase [Tritonibacter mobilis]NHM22585.1 GNAT family N-acetyltransferase [Tritonibacter mobilis]